MSYTSTVSPSLRQFHLFFCQKTFTDGPTSALWSKLLLWGATGVRRVPAVFGEYTLRVLAVFRGSVLRMLSILQVFRGSILWILRYSQCSYCSYSHYSQYSGLRYCSYSQHPQYSGLLYFSYSQYSQYETYSIRRVYSKYEVYWEHLCKLPHPPARYTTSTGAVRGFWWLQVHEASAFPRGIQRNVDESRGAAKVS